MIYEHTNYRSYLKSIYADNKTTNEITGSSYASLGSRVLIVEAYSGQSNVFLPNKFEASSSLHTYFCKKTEREFWINQGNDYLQKYLCTITGNLNN